MSEPATIIAVSFAGLSALGAIFSSYYSLRSHLFSQKKERSEVFHNFLQRYSTIEMDAAVKHLYDFKIKKFDKRDDKAITLKEMYEAECQEDEDTTEEGGIFEKLENKRPYLESTLRYHRRCVSHFYHEIYVALQENIVTKDAIFGYWAPGTLNGIIRSILIPIGQDPDKHLEDLCTMAEEWEQKNRK